MLARGFATRLPIVILAVACAVLIVLVLASACGSDPYSGTWKATDFSGGASVLVIEKDDGGWTMTDPKGRSFAATEKEGRLVGGGVSCERVGDKLVVRLGTTVVHRYVRVQ